MNAHPARKGEHSTAGYKSFINAQAKKCKIVLFFRCGKAKQERACIEKDFSCDKPCGKPLKCGNHNCEIECHAGACEPCVREGTNACPCGKQKYTDVHCINDVPCCSDTCAKKLPCGHECVVKCHRFAINSP